MIDIHCHILPGIDDGSKTLEESMSMAQIAAMDGIHSIVATPHTMDNVYYNPAKKIKSFVLQLKESLSQSKINMQLYMGSDAHICTQITDKIKAGDVTTINDGMRYLLLEIPSQSIPQGLKDEIFSLKLNGITPIITHPERNFVIQKNPNILSDFIRMGALSQITAMSITGEFGNEVKACAKKLLLRRMVHVIASDAHSSTYRKPILSDAVKAAIKIVKNREMIERMVTDTPEAILAGKSVDIDEPC